MRRIFFSKWNILYLEVKFWFLQMVSYFWNMPCRNEVEILLCSSSVTGDVLLKIAAGHHLSKYCIERNSELCSINSSPPGQNGRYFPNDIFRCILMNEKFCILISLKFVPKGTIDNIQALVWIMAWRLIGNKPLSEPMLTRLTDIYAALGGEELSRGRWVKYMIPNIAGPSTQHLLKHNMFTSNHQWSNPDVYG